MRESLNQVVDLVRGERQTELGIGRLQRRRAAVQHINVGQRRGRQFIEQTAGTGTVEHHALGHAVVQQVTNLRQLQRRQRRFTKQTGLERHTVFKNPLNPAHCQTAVVRDVGCLRGPGRDRAKAWRHHKQRAIASTAVGWAVAQQGCQLGHELGVGFGIGGHQMHKAGGDIHDPVVDRLQAGQQLLNTERAECATALELADGQGHVGGLKRLADWVDGERTAPVQGDLPRQWPEF